MKRLLILVLLNFFFALTAFAETGITLTAPLIAKDPSQLHGFRTALWYQPPRLIWPHMRVFFDVSYGYWWRNASNPYRTENIFAAAPTLRFYLRPDRYFSPFIDFSIGLAYLSATRFGKQNLGEHFAFQDQLGIGATLGKEQRLSISLSALHYSNGSLCKKNSGITIPLLLNIGYQLETR